MIKIKLYTEGQLVIFRILEMSESLREREKPFFLYKDKQITSERHPELTMYTCYLRGSCRADDNLVAYVECATPECAETVKQEWLEVFRAMEAQQTKPLEDKEYYFTNSTGEFIKIKLYTEGQLVIFRVLDMSDSLRGTGELANFGGINLSSCCHPALSPLGVAVGGSDTHLDNYVASYEFADKSEAQAYKKKVLELFHHWGSGSIPPHGEKDVYTFNIN